jgi:anti-anti-sigma factor
MATPADITIEDLQTDNAQIVAKIAHFTGQLDESNVDEKSQQIYNLIEEIPQNLNLILDFEGLEYMNSKSIGYLTDWYGKIFESGGKVVIAQAKPNILDILQVVGLTQLIKTFPTIDEAKMALTQ